MIQENDGDADGKLSREELPADMQDRFQDSDADGDGFLDSQELVAMLDGGGAPSFVGGGAGQ
jgi:Ca2+-binding EF-hand superfamily protein